MTLCAGRMKQWRSRGTPPRGAQRPAFFPFQREPQLLTCLVADWGLAGLFDVNSKSLYVNIPFSVWLPSPPNQKQRQGPRRTDEGLRAGSRCLPGARPLPRSSLTPTVRGVPASGCNAARAHAPLEAGAGVPRGLTRSQRVLGPSHVCFRGAFASTQEPCADPVLGA